MLPIDFSKIHFQRTFCGFFASFFCFVFWKKIASVADFLMFRCLLQILFNHQNMINCFLSFPSEARLTAELFQIDQLYWSRNSFFFWTKHCLRYFVFRFFFTFVDFRQARSVFEVQRQTSCFPDSLKWTTFGCDVSTSPCSAPSSSCSTRPTPPTSRPTTSRFRSHSTRRSSPKAKKYGKTFSPWRRRRRRRHRCDTGWRHWSTPGRRTSSTSTRTAASCRPSPRSTASSWASTTSKWSQHSTTRARKLPQRLFRSEQFLTRSRTTWRALIAPEKQTYWSKT